MKKIFESTSAFYSVLFSYLSLFLYGLLDNMRGPIYPSLIQKFYLSNTQGSWFFSTTSLVFMIAAALAPHILYHRGYLVSLREGLISVLLSQIIFYFAPSFSTVLFGCILMGYGFGILSVLQNVLVLIASPHDKINQIVNGLHANYAAASLLAPLLVALIFRYQFGFEFMFLIGAFITLLLLLGCYWISHIKEPKAVSVPDLGNIFQTKFLPIGIMLSSYVAGEVLVSSRLSQFLILTYGFQGERASLWTSAFFISLLLGRMTFTLVSVSVPIKKILVWLLGFSIVTSFLGTFILPHFFIVLGFIISPIYALIMVMAKKEFPNELELIASLVIVLSGVFVIFMHTSVGWVTDTWSIQTAFYLAPVFFSICLAFLKGRFHEH